jgi:hypothetical protein
MPVDPEVARVVAREVADQVADALVGEWGNHANVTAIGVAARVRFEPTDLDPSDSGQTVIAYNVVGKDARSADKTERAYVVRLFETAAEIARTPPVDPQDLPPLD